MFAGETFHLVKLDLGQSIESHGGSIAKTLVKKVTIVVTETELPASKMATVKSRGVPVVTPAFITDCIAAGKMLKPADYLFGTESEPVNVVDSQESGRPKRGKAKSYVQDDDADEEPENVAAVNSKKKRAKKDEDSEVEDQETVKAKGKKRVKEEIVVDSTVKRVVKGAAVVDECCPIASQCHVVQSGGDVYDAMLNQTNISSNNNKFYLLQVLRKDGTDQYYAWFRWGRVGARGQSKLEECGNALPLAVRSFLQKFSDKTKNRWEDRANFVKVQGKYFILERDFGPDLPEEPAEEKVEVQSKLAEPVKDLMSMIFSINMMNDQMREIGYDAQKLPLGKLSKNNIQKGYDSLTKLGAELKKPSPDRHALMDLSSEFYTIIPHVFGMTRPPVIDSENMLKLKLEMLEALSEIEIATSLIKKCNQVSDIHPLDQKYASLKCGLQPVERASSDFQIIEKYVKNTHAATHDSYSLEIADVFQVDRDGEAGKFQSQVSNRMLLWHGSRLTNFVGILSQGLRIAPPEAPVTGYMFGKGIYFADMISKSANYCCTSKNSRLGLLLLCDVALGTPNQLTSSDYDAHKPVDMKSFHSTKGVGKTFPDPKDTSQLDGSLVPHGKPITFNVTDSNLLYNEYIVYRPDQVRIKYLVKARFHYK